MKRLSLGFNEERYEKLLADFRAAFGREAAGLFSAPGRTELGGNHTDHQGGRVLAASVDLDIAAAAGPNEENVIRVYSPGFSAVEIPLQNLEGPRPEERNTSQALVRGTAARCRRLGVPVAGFDAFLHSAVPGGSGLSSSAAYEVLLAGIMNELFYKGRLNPMELAQTGQYAENEYFGKPSGLLDQMGSAMGGVVAADFQNPSFPKVEKIRLDLEREGYALCILDTGADHAGLTAEYAAVAEEMGAVARALGCQVLSQADEREFMSQLPRLRAETGDRAVMRAMHFFGETRRAREQAEALKQGDMPRFLALVNESGRSSASYLQNVIPAGRVFHQELALTLALCERALGGRGAFRLHGGGFGGTAQAFVPLEMLESFRTQMEAVLGSGRCHVVSIRPVGFAKIGG